MDVKIWGLNFSVLRLLVYAVFDLNTNDMIKAPKNTFKYAVFSTDFGVYLYISLN